MARTLNVDDIHKALRSQYNDLETDVSAPDSEHPIEAVATVLLSSAVLGTTDSDRLVRFTGYSRQFVSGIALNMRNNRLWGHGQYDCSGWFDPQGGIFDDRRFWEDHQVALGIMWRPSVEPISIDVCSIYWSELKKNRNRA